MQRMIGAVLTALGRHAVVSQVFRHWYFCHCLFACLTQGVNAIPVLLNIWAAEPECCFSGNKQCLAHCSEVTHIDRHAAEQASCVLSLTHTQRHTQLKSSYHALLEFFDVDTQYHVSADT